MNIQVGDRITYKDKYTNELITYIIIDEDELKNYINIERQGIFKTLKIERVVYKEVKKEILDNIEKEYLSALIKPFRNKVKYIKKIMDCTGEFINIEIISDEGITLPYFKTNTMYKNMIPFKGYTVKELGL